jgi:hypothetical protein
VPRDEAEKGAKVGKTNSPLVIWLDESLASLPEFQELIDKGHQIIKFTHEADLIFSPQAHYMTQPMIGYVEEALKRARAIKKGKKDG